MTLAKLVDFLFSCSAGQREDRTANICGPRPMLKALSWLQRHAQIPALAPIIQNPLVLAFHASEGPVDRREAIPIPLAVIASWERCVCHDSAPDALRLFLGGLLLAAHASLRFGDLQRIQVTRLCLTSSALRGLCWATKTTRQGQPFAVTVMGFTGRDISTSWVVHWLRALAQSLARTQREFGSEHCPDFALPSFSPSNVLACPIYNAPLAYSQALAALRWAAQTPWAPSPCLTESEASNLTLHSLKVTVLSAALQLRLPEEDRRVQGHHKLSSTRLYGRDDTHQALWVQRQLARALSRQWRPQRPMARGGQQPTLEPPFQVRPQDPPDTLALRDLPSDLQRFINAREAQVQPTPNLEEEPMALSAQVEEDSAESGEPDSISASEHSPQPMDTGSHAPGAPPQIQDGARQDYVLLGGGPRGLAGQLRGDARSYGMRVPPGRIQHHQGGGSLIGTLP